jgi:hypothetical protein
MFLLKRFSPYIIIILNIGVLEILLKKSALIFWLAPILTLIILILVWLMARKPLGAKAASRFVLTYFLLQAGLIASLLFLEKAAVKQLLIITATLALALHQEYLFRFLYRPEKYRAYSLENLTGSINLLTFILAALAIFGFIVFMDMTLLLATLLIAVMVFFCYILFLRAAKIELKKNWWFILATGLIILEIFTVLSWLPFNFYLKALLLSTSYYLMADLSRHIITETNNTKNVFWPACVGGVLWLLLFITERWT